MPFNKRRKTEEQNFSHPSDRSLSRFVVSDRSFGIGTIVSSLTILIILTVLVILKVTYTLSETDLQSICQITAGLSGLTLAVPLFLKDFEITSNFWRQFYLIAITFLAATFIGLFSFLQINATETKEITIYLWFFFSLTISISITTIGSFRNWFRINVRLNPLTNFCISYAILIASLTLAKGNFLFYAVILFTIFGVYLTLSLMCSILVELFFPTGREDNDSRIKKGIEVLVNQYKNEALEEQVLIDRLKMVVFPNEQDIVSRSKIQELTAEMDLETVSGNPKLTIYEYNFVIPRWTKEFDEILKNSYPKYFFLVYSTYKFEDELDFPNLLSDSSFLKVHENKIYQILSQNTSLSSQLLKENNSLIHKYKIARYIRSGTYSSPKTFFLLLIDRNTDYRWMNGGYFSSQELDFIADNHKEVYYADDISFEIMKKHLR